MFQIQLDPSVPTNIPPAQLDDFGGFLQGVMNNIIGTSGPILLTAGQDLWTGLAAIMVVWTGVKIAMSGSFQPWELIRLVIALWVPWAMLHFYDTPLPVPANAYTFPGMIVGGGNWLMEFFMADAGTAMRTELSNMVNTHMTRITDAWDGYNIWELITSSGRALISLAMATIMVIFTGMYARHPVCRHLRTGDLGADCNCNPHLPGGRFSSPGCCLSRCRFCSGAGSVP